MTTFAEIPSVKIRVVGDMHTGWGPADAAEFPQDQIRELEFKLAITDDGARSYLLLVESFDGSCYADTWHQTFEEAMQVARESFGVAEDTWSRP
jgi:hypothetical protein